MPASHSCEMPGFSESVWRKVLAWQYSGTVAPTASILSATVYLLLLTYTPLIAILYGGKVFGKVVAIHRANWPKCSHNA